jgi:TolA-binding protein
MVNVRLTLGMGVLALVLMGGGFLLGDDKKPDDKEPKAKGTLPQHWKQLGLTDDQVQKVYKIESTYRTKIDALKQQIEDLKDEEKAEMQKLLTDAQKARLKELKLGEKDPPKDKGEEKDKKPAKDDDKKPAKDEKPKDKGADK